MPPFLIVLPLQMLKQHIVSPTIRVFSEIKLPVSPLTACTIPMPASQQIVNHDILDFSETDDRAKSDDKDDDNDDVDIGGGPAESLL